MPQLGHRRCRRPCHRQEQRGNNRRNALSDVDDLLLQRQAKSFQGASAKIGAAGLHQSRVAAPAGSTLDGRRDLMLVNRRAPL
ncbi:MAG: hypothetical protein AAF676_04610, partial [Pseudomonadota bacterium]